MSEDSKNLESLFSNLQISDDESLDFENYHDCIIHNLLRTIKTSGITYKINIFDNVIILDNILFGINVHFFEEEDKDNILPYKPILRLPAFNSQNFPQKNDPKWWNAYCSEFECSMVHLRNSSFGNSSSNINEIFSQPNVIEFEITNLIISILNNNNDNTLEINLVQMYIISIYLENFFIKNNIGSIYNDEFLYTNKYFTKFGRLALEYLNSKDPYFSFNVDYYEKHINNSLLNVLYGARNTLILFGPYGYNALYENLAYIDLNIREIIGFKREALRYFALNNLIELEIHNKKLHINNINEYVSIICNGAQLFE